MFEAFYAKHLAKRLLYDNSASLDLEKTMISTLKSDDSKSALPTHGPLLS